MKNLILFFDVMSMAHARWDKFSELHDFVNGNPVHNPTALLQEFDTMLDEIAIIDPNQLKKEAIQCKASLSLKSYFS